AQSKGSPFRSARMARFRFARGYPRAATLNRAQAQLTGHLPNEDLKADANRQPVDPQAAAASRQPQPRPGAAELAAEARRLHPRLYDDAEEAELRAAQGGEGAPDQRLRGDRLYPGRGAQPAGALGGDDPRRPRQGPAGRALPHP